MLEIVCNSIDWSSMLAVAHGLLLLVFYNFGPIMHVYGIMQLFIFMNYAIMHIYGIMQLCIFMETALNSTKNDHL